MLKPEQQQVESIAFPEKDIFQVMLSESDTVIIKPEHRNTKGKLLTEDGKVSHLQNELYWKIIRTPSFKKWFGNSVVRDGNGEPKLVYRATLKKNFDISDGVHFKTNAQSWRENHFGTFFTSSRKSCIAWFTAVYNDETETSRSSYDEEVFLAMRESFLKNNEQQVKVFTAFIKLENPYIENGWTELSRQEQHLISIADFKNRTIQGGEKFLEELRSNHDGLYLPHSTDFGDEYAVINSGNIFMLPSDPNEGVKEKEYAESHEDYSRPALRPKRNLFSRILQRVSRH